jgi:hypothetical protein
VSQLRVAEFDLYQEISEEGLREILRQMSENIRNLQAQKDELENRILSVELDGLNTESQATSSSLLSSNDSVIYAIALG